MHQAEVFLIHRLSVLKRQNKRVNALRYCKHACCVPTKNPHPIVPVSV